jgi:phosphoribosyl-ATP pyrophosphohydrolase
MPVFWDGLLNYISRCIDSEIEIDKKDVCVVACDFYKKGSILISRKCLAKAGGQINANKDGTKEELISELYDCYVVFREKDMSPKPVLRHVQICRAGC